MIEYSWWLNYAKSQTWSEAFFEEFSTFPVIDRVWSGEATVVCAEKVAKPSDRNPPTRAFKGLLPPPSSTAGKDLKTEESSRNLPCAFYLWNWILRYPKSCNRSKGNCLSKHLYVSWVSSSEEVAMKSSKHGAWKQWRKSHVLALVVWMKPFLSKDMSQEAIYLILQFLRVCKFTWITWVNRTKSPTMRSPFRSFEGLQLWRHHFVVELVWKWL